MFGRLPPLTALRAFESAARLGSFKQAAEELYVSPTAISHQVRSLENALGMTMFVRSARRSELTEAGRALAPALTSAFLAIRTAVDEVVEASAIVSVSVTSAFAALRLVPELPGFYARHPDIRVKIDTSTAVVDLRKDVQTDLAIRYGFGPYAGLENVRLMGEKFYALAAPGRFGEDDIAGGATLLETQWQSPALAEICWDRWFEMAALQLPAPGRIVAFDDELHVLQAAIAGQGIALASSALAADLLARRLLEKVKPDVALDGAYYTTVALPERAHGRSLRLLIDWLQETFTTTDR